MLAAIYYGTQYGGTITSVLLNTPGEAASAITCLEGYEMAKQGRGGAALSIAAIGSFFGDTVATVGLVLLAMPLTSLALQFGPPEFFALMREFVLQAAEGGIAVAVHAIGDAANRTILDVLEQTVHAWRPAGLRQRIEHVQLLHPQDANRLGALGVVASMQPSHATADWEIAERYWAGRTGLAYAWRTVLDSGAVLAFGSDCPVEPMDPMGDLYAAVTRQTADGRPSKGWHPEQRLTPLEALEAYTLGSAFASGEERIKGSLCPGKLADFVVLSDDPFTGPPERFLSTKVLATVVGGKVVYGEL